MPFRFRLYTFLRNQQFFAPFILLALLESGLSYAAVGTLYMIREVTVNLLEVPSGAVADARGRRFALASGMIAYVGAFLVLGLCSGFWPFAGAMVLFGAGEAFRSGTHKAMIYRWLELRGQRDQKAEQYGRIRAWGKVGALVSVVIATGLTLWTGAYGAVFVAAAFPCVANAVNVALYPAELEGSASGTRPLRQVVRELITAIGRPELRALLVRSVSYEGLFKTVKDYVQPMLRALCVTLPFYTDLGDFRRTSLLVGGFYVAVHALSAVASRYSGAMARRLPDGNQSERFFWGANAVLFLCLGLGLALGSLPLVFGAFLLFLVMQNLWKPINTAAIADGSDERLHASVLSIQSQARSLVAAVLAPLVGLLVDSLGGGSLLPVAGVGLTISVSVLVLSRSEPQPLHRP